MQHRDTIFRFCRGPFLTTAAAVVAFSGLAFPPLAPNQLPPVEKSWKQVCERALSAPLKPPSFPRVQPDSWLRNCDSEALYYGFTASPNYPEAMQCAYYQRAHPEPSSGNPFYGPGVLMMLYANGKGVPRNYDLAIRFACENTWAADAEMEYRIGRLEHLRDTHAITTHFDLCDDGTSGLTEGACALVQESLADAKRTRQIREISATWPTKVTAAFPSLQKAENAFVKARVENEVDLSGTGRVAFQLEEEGVLRDQFLINLKRFAEVDVPAATDRDSEQLEKTLDLLLGQIQSSSGSAWQFTTVTPNGIGTTQRAWLSLLQAWTDFGRVAYPRLDTNRIRAQIIRLRIHQLRSLVKDHVDSRKSSTSHLASPSISLDSPLSIW